MEDTDKLLVGPLQHLDDASHWLTSAWATLHTRDDLVAVHRSVEPGGGDEDVLLAPSRDDESVATPDDLEPADDEVDLLGNGVTLPLHLVEPAVSDQAVEDPLEGPVSMGRYVPGHERAAWP